MRKPPVDAPAPVLTFEAALAGGGLGRKAMTYDAEGEVILALQISTLEARDLLLAVADGRLLGRTFTVTMAL